MVLLVLFFLPAYGDTSLEVIEVADNDLLVGRVPSVVHGVPGPSLSIQFRAVLGVVPLRVTVEALVIANAVDLHGLIPTLALGLEDGS